MACGFSQVNRCLRTSVPYDCVFGKGIYATYTHLRKCISHSIKY